MKTEPILTLPFEQFGSVHMIVIGVTLFVSVFLSLIVRRSRRHAVRQLICIGIAALLLAAEGFNYIYVLARYGVAYFMAEALPLHVCGLTLYLTTYLLITKDRRIFAIVYFWAFAGTTQALLTPIAQAGFPSWDCFHFFITHGGVIVGASVATFGLRMRPTLKGLWMTYVLSWVLMVVVSVLDTVLGANYMYLCAPPSGNTPFYFLPWPWYIPFLGLLALIFYILLWLPFVRPGRRTA